MTDVMESEGDFFLVEVENDAFEIAFRPRKGVVVPDDVARLRSQIERTLTSLRVMFPDDKSEFERKRLVIYFQKLAGIAIAGIGQNHTPLGIAALELLKDEIVARESRRIKIGYLRRVAIPMGVGVAALVAIYAILAWGWAPDCPAAAASNCPAAAASSDKAATISNFVILIAGGLVGTWLSIASREIVGSFSELAALNDDLIEPWIRLAYVAGLTLCIGLIFSTGLLNITIDRFNADITKSGQVALLIGLFCGLAEKTLSQTVSRRATSFLAPIAPSLPSPDPTGVPTPPRDGAPAPDGSTKTPADRPSAGGEPQDRADKPAAADGASIEKDGTVAQADPVETPPDGTKTPPSQNT